MQQQDVQIPAGRHKHRGGPLGWLMAILHIDGHAHAEPELGSDPALATGEGIRTVWIAPSGT